MERYMSHSRKQYKQQEMFPELESQKEDLKDLLAGTIQELVTQILSDQDLKLEKTTTCYESQVVLPLTMVQGKYKVSTLGMEVRLSLKLRVVPTPSSEETSVPRKVGRSHRESQRHPHKGWY